MSKFISAKDLLFYFPSMKKILFFCFHIDAKLRGFWTGSDVCVNSITNSVTKLTYRVFSLMSPICLKVETFDMTHMYN